MRDEPRPAAIASPTDAVSRLRDRSYVLLVVAVICVSTCFVLHRAWVTDDAFISFRHVQNVYAGNGPVFNAGERVQGYSHPLWFLLLVLGSAVTNTYTAAISLGLACSILTLSLLAWFLRGYTARIQAFLLACMLFLGSSTFVEFQTSGLETALSVLLVAALVGSIASRDQAGQPPSLPAVWWLCTLLVLNRPDHIILVAPILAASVACWQAQRRSRSGPGRSPQLVRALLAVLPLVGWYGFATLYYGSPLPNTAYAKTSAPLAVRLHQGLAYAQVYATEEPVQVAIVIAVIIVALTVGRRLFTPPARMAPWVGLSMLCHLGYVTVLGGDFMRGRFYLPVLAGTVVLGAHLWAACPFRSVRVRYWTLAAASGTLLLLICGTFIHSSNRFVPLGGAIVGLAGVVWAERRRTVCVAIGLMGTVVAAMGSTGDMLRGQLLYGHSGISSEWGWYSSLSWGNPFVEPVRYGHPFPELSRRFGKCLRRYAEQNGSITVAVGAIGIVSWHAGPQVLVIDRNGLTDPFIARGYALPRSRVGHPEYDISRSYLEARGDVSILPAWESRVERDDPALRREAAALPGKVIWTDAEAEHRYQLVERVTRGPIFSWERLRCLPRFILPVRPAGPGPSTRANDGCVTVTAGNRLKGSG
jgi:arabinofuranosyltransferase